MKVEKKKKKKKGLYILVPSHGEEKGRQSAPEYVVIPKLISTCVLYLIRSSHLGGSNSLSFIHPELQSIGGTIMMSSA